jgi:hypothetical protein
MELSLAKRRLRQWVVVLVTPALASCGDDDSTGPPPPDVQFGETTIVVIVNPPVNDVNSPALPVPGSARAGVTVTADDGVSAVTGATGIAVLSNLTPGTRTLSISDGSDTGEIDVSLAEGDLREVAVAFDANGASIMTSILYEVSGQLTEVNPLMSVTEVNDALSQSNTIVFFRGGVYAGDLQFSGSNLTLFGEGSTGGQVTIIGNVTVGGSNNRFRGAVVTGDLSVPGSGAGVSFGRVNGAFELSGSSGVLLNNAYCGTASAPGSNATAVGNAGLAPVPASEGGC